MPSPLPLHPEPTAATLSAIAAAAPFSPENPSGRVQWQPLITAVQTHFAATAAPHPAASRAAVLALLSRGSAAHPPLLLSAVAEAKPAYVGLLLSLGVRPAAGAGLADEAALLRMCMCHPDTAVARLLLAYGVPKSGVQRALANACAEANESFVRLLVCEYRADGEDVGPCGRNALHYVASGRGRGRFEEGAAGGGGGGGSPNGDGAGLDGPFPSERPSTDSEQNVRIRIARLLIKAGVRPEARLWASWMKDQPSFRDVWKGGHTPWQLAEGAGWGRLAGVLREAAALASPESIPRRGTAAFDRR